jgi:2-polyprenyl-6-hydroxyphenyl methylase / 3-demethylubiquinone-9 3-methyltransferase
MSKQHASSQRGSGAHVAPIGVDTAELAKFAELADRWWDVRGPMRPLHLMNPLRLDYVLSQAALHLGLDRDAPQPLTGRRVLDVGCGAGLLSEPLARLGGRVTGIDPEPGMIEAARLHAAESELSIAYEARTVDDLVGEGRSFDLAVALEVIEHVPDGYAFVSGLAQLLAPGGVLVLSTLSRTLKAWVQAIAGAEYALGWLPRGTHRWSRFVKPSELAELLRDVGMIPVDVTGVAFDPGYERFRFTRDPRVNYLLAAKRAD